MKKEKDVLTVRMSPGFHIRMEVLPDLFDPIAEQLHIFETDVGGSPEFSRREAVFFPENSDEIRN